MTRSKWAVLGLSALALLAMSVFVASGAQANKENPEFTCIDTEGKLPGHGEGKHAACTVTGEQATTDRKHDEAIQHNHQYDAGVGTLTCATTIFHIAEDADGTNKTPTATPTYEECTASAGPTTAHVDMNGCAFEFHPKKTTEKTVAEDEYEGTSSIECPKDQSITITITDKHNEVGNVKCTIHIHPQAGIGPVYFRTMTHNTHTVGEETTETLTDVTVEADTAVVKATFTGGFFNCGVFGEEANTFYTGNTTVQAKDAGGNLIDLELD